MRILRTTLPRVLSKSCFAENSFFISVFRRLECSLVCLSVVNFPQSASKYLVLGPSPKKPLRLGVAFDTSSRKGLKLANAGILCVPDTCGEVWCAGVCPFGSYGDFFLSSICSAVAVFLFFLASLFPFFCENLEISGLCQLPIYSELRHHKRRCNQAVHVLYLALMLPCPLNCSPECLLHFAGIILILPKKLCLAKARHMRRTALQFKAECLAQCLLQPQS